MTQLHDLIGSRRVSIQSYLEDKTRQLLVIGTKNETLRKGMYYRLSINFVSQLNDNLNGLYRASYHDEDGKKKWLFSKRNNLHNDIFMRKDKACRFLLPFSNIGI